MIFVNYRKDDTKQVVTHLHRQLVSRYGKDQIFVDFDGIEIGDDWNFRLKEQLESRKILMVIIGSQWGKVQMTQGKNTGRQRLDIKEDWVRQEICTGIQRRDAKLMEVIVVLIDDAKLPETEWGCELDKLQLIQSTILRNQDHFERDFIDLCERMEKKVPALKKIAALRSKSVQKSRSASSDNLSKTVVDQYLKVELPNHGVLQLPLVSPNGQFVSASMDDLRIDLPLIITQEQSSKDPQHKARWSGKTVLDLHSRFRDTHTNALIVDRTSRIEDISRDCNIEEKLHRGSRLAVVGDPGCGKSTLLQWIAFHYGSTFTTESSDTVPAPDNAQQLPPHNWLPILILCRELAEQPIPTQLEDLLRIHLKSRQFPDAMIEGSKMYFQELLEQGRAILLVDGLDEIPDSEQRIKFCKLLVSIANRYRQSPIIITSRVVGFQAVQSELSLKFDHLLVCPLDWQAKQAFVACWSKLLDWDPEKRSNFTELVCHSRDFAKLTENVFLLAMVAQIQILDQDLPTRRIDVYRRAVQLMIERRRPFSGPPLEVNEIIPHLEYLAYWMRQKGLQRCTEIEVVDFFLALRKEETEEMLRKRTPKELLQACIHSLGILHVAGTETDAKGYDRQVIEFSHQSFQEYFAGQAIKHGFGAQKEVEITNNPIAIDDLPGKHGFNTNGETAVIGRLRGLLAKIDVREREVNLWGEHNITEPVLADFWQETFRMLIADLNPGEADEAIKVLLPNPQTPPKEARPRAIFALQCLADEPQVSQETVLAVFDAVMDNLQDGDGYSTKLNTWMDEAIAAVAQSTLGTQLRERLLDGYIHAWGERRNWIGCCLALRSVDNHQKSVAHLESDIESGVPPTFSRASEGENAGTVTPQNASRMISDAISSLESNKPAERIRIALELMNRFFITNGKLGFLTQTQKTFLLESLMSALSKDEATESAIIWTLNWLTGAKRRMMGNKLSEAALPNPVTQFVLLESPVITKIEQILKRPDVDIFTLSLGVLILTREKTLNPVIHQMDWIYELARIADGEVPRKSLPLPQPTHRTAAVDWLKDLLKSGMDERHASRIAQTLGAFGVYTPEMVKPLGYLFQNKKYSGEDRDEALLYLGFIGTAAAKQILIEAADTPPVEKDDYLWGRGLFGLLLADDVDILAQQLAKALPHSDLNAYAFGLVGSRDARGLTLLKTMKNHPNLQIRNAVKKALACSWAPRSSSWF